MEAIRGLIANVPDWIKRLDELNGQIDQRQLELARFDLSTSASSTPGRAKSIRNKGSTESLRPKGEPAVHPDDKAHGTHGAHDPHAPAVPTTPVTPTSPITPTARSPIGLNSASALQKQTSQVMEVAHAKARATLQKRNRRSNSLMSADAIAAANKYRTRSMIIVYYDSYVQSFFEELVKFVSASRNMMRKAKMAAKVAKIRRLADLEMPELEAKDSSAPPTVTPPHVIAAPGGDIIAAADNLTPDDSPMPLNFVSMRQMRASARMGGRPGFSRSGAGYMGSPQEPDVYDELDKGLEFIQSTCEHAAHQFLRDGECTEEIEKVKKRLAETKEIADREMERVKREDPEALKELDEPPKARMLRPQSMRRGMPAKEVAMGPIAAATPAAPVALEVDTEADTAANSMDVDKPKMVYKTADMR